MIREDVCGKKIELVIVSILYSVPPYETPYKKLLLIKIYLNLQKFR